MGRFFRYDYEHCYLEQQTDYESSYAVISENTAPDYPVQSDSRNYLFSFES